MGNRKTSDQKMSLEISVQYYGDFGVILCYGFTCCDCTVHVVFIVFTYGGYIGVFTVFTRGCYTVIFIVLPVVVILFCLLY